MADNNDIMATVLTPSGITEAFGKMLRINFDNAEKNGKRAPLFVWGPPGIGKSMLFEQECKKRNLLLIDIRLTQMEPTDLRGIPVPVAKQVKEAVDTMISGSEESTEEIQSVTGVDMVEVRWAIPGFLPQINTKDGKWDGWYKGHKYDGFVILLDELPNAAPSVQAGSYQLVLDGKLGEYEVPSNGVIFAAGNRQNDKGGTYKMPLPLVNRFVHLEMEASFKEWQQYAICNDINSKVIGYLTVNSGSLTEEKMDDPDRGFRSPRAWERVSDILNDEEKYGNTTSQKTLRALIHGAIGRKGALDFVVHCDEADKLPDPMKILMGEITSIPAETQEQAALCYTLAMQLCGKIQSLYKNMNSSVGEEHEQETAKLYKACNNFFSFVMHNFRDEMNVLAGRTLLNMYNIDNIDLDRIEKFDAFIEKYQDLIADS